jgi:hypothetical protein
VIYLKPKAPADVVDYLVDMTEFVHAGFSIHTVSVEIEAAGNGESPMTLTVEDVAAEPLIEGAPVSLGVLFWLAGGSPGVRYQGRISIADDPADDPDRSCERLFQVEVEPL